MNYYMMLYQYNNINQTLRSLYFRRTKERFVVYILLHDLTRLEYSLSADQLCCEIVGCVGSTDSLSVPILIENERARLSLRSTVWDQEYLDRYIKADRPCIKTGMEGNIVQSITVTSAVKENVHHMTLRICFEGDKEYCAVFFNIHNGYYCHNVSLNIFEKGDKEPMKVFTSVL